MSPFRSSVFISGMHAFHFLCFTFFLSFFFSTQRLAAQENQEIMIKGLIKSADFGERLSQIMIVNKRLGNGIFAEADGSFRWSAWKSDTILITALGHQTLKFSYKDSAQKKEFYLKLSLQKLQVQLKEVEIFPQREISEIEKDVQKLHYNKEDYMLSGINSFSSPITFLYQAFSKRERGKRLAAELRNDDKKRSLLKELLSKYVDGKIISLNEDQFDEFIDFCRVSEEFMKSSTQYEFIMYIKKRFLLYAEIRKR